MPARGPSSKFIRARIGTGGRGDSARPTPKARDRGGPPPYLLPGAGDSGCSVQLCAQLVPGVGRGALQGGQGARRSRPRGGAGCGEERSWEDEDWLQASIHPLSSLKVSIKRSAVHRRKLRPGTGRADLKGTKVVRKRLRLTRERLGTECTGRGRPAVQS